MRSRCARAPALLATLLCSAPASADPAVWLARADDAVRTLSFDATVVRHHGNYMRVVRIRQSYDGIVLRQRVSTERSEHCLTIPARSDRGYPIPHGGLTRLLPSQQPGVDESWKLARYYKARLGGQEQVAERPCRIVQMLSRDRYRYGCEFCLDIASGLPLRLRMHKGDGEPTEQYVFASLTVQESAGRFAPGTFEDCGRPAGGGRGMREAVAEDAPPWEVSALPPGFEMRKSWLRRGQRFSMPVRHIVIADPLSQVSVFIVPVAERAFGGDLRAPHAYMTRRDQYQIMVLGKVPTETKRMIGESIQLRR